MQLAALQVTVPGNRRRYACCVRQAIACSSEHGSMSRVARANHGAPQERPICGAAWQSRYRHRLLRQCTGSTGTGSPGENGHRDRHLRAGSSSLVPFGFISRLHRIAVEERHTAIASDGCKANTNEGMAHEQSCIATPDCVLMGIGTSYEVRSTRYVLVLVRCGARDRGNVHSGFLPILSLLSSNPFSCPFRTRGMGF